MKNVVIVGLVAIAVYLLLALTFSQVMPFSRAFDEGYHLDYITFIKVAQFVCVIVVICYVLFLPPLSSALVLWR